MKNIIAIKNLSFFYNKKRIFNNLNLDIEEGNWITIVGNNGSGKTTLASILLKKLQYDGEVIVPKNIGSIMEKFKYNNLNDYLNVTFNDEITKNNFISEYNLKTILNLNYDNQDNSFQKFILFISLLTKDFKVILLDNLLDEIEDKYKQKIIKILKKLNKKGITIVNFSQNLDDALLGNKIAILDKGNIVLNGSKEEIFSNEKKLKELNLNLPFIIDLSTKLRYYRMVDKLYYNSEDLVDEVWK